MPGINPSHQGRLQPHQRNRAGAVRQSNHLAAGQADAQLARRVVSIPEAEAAQVDEEGVALANIAAGPLHRTRPVAGSSQLGDQLRGGKRGPRINFQRPCVDARRHLPASAFELGGDLAVQPENVAAKSHHQDDQRPKNSGAPGALAESEARRRKELAQAP